MHQKKSYPAKLLLFGEYTIIQGAKALAVPLPNFSGSWEKSGKHPNPEQQKGLPKLLDYLKKNKRNYDATAFEIALNEGDFFESNIPQGYGAGSSGAVCAAVYDRFALRKINPEVSKNKAADLKRLKRELGEMESCFHGASSGVDPLVCYLNKVLFFKTPENIHPISSEEVKLDGFFLIDTGIRRETAPFVKLFKEWCEEEIYSLRLEVELIPLVEDAIDAFLEKNTMELLDLMHQISHFQFKYFSEMIPAAFRTAWLDCLASDHTKLKLCGAGGGGFILAYSHNLTKAKDLLSDYNLVFLTH